MDLNTNIDLIIKDLEEAAVLIDDLGHYPGVPAFQIEVAKAKCRSSASLIGLLKTLIPLEGKTAAATVEAPAPVAPASPAAIPDIPVVRKEENTVIREAKHEDKVIITEALTDSSEEKTVVESLSEHRDEKNQVLAAEKPLAEPEPRISESHIIADKFAGTASTLNEQAGRSHHTDNITEMLSHKPISSLTGAIGINDRFLFIREIFNGNKETYEHALAKLENLSSEDDARAVLMSYTGISEESAAVRQLLGLIRRKIRSDE